MQPLRRPRPTIGQERIDQIMFAEFLIDDESQWRSDEAVFLMDTLPLFRHIARRLKPQVEARSHGLFLNDVSIPHIFPNHTPEGMLPCPQFPVHRDIKL